MARTYKPSTDLSKLTYDFQNNPLIDPQSIHTKTKWSRAYSASNLIDITTGEITAVNAVHSIKEVDDIEFVKIFADGVTAGFDLTGTAQKVFREVLQQYQQTPMQGGYADYVELFWFENTINGNPASISQYTFHRGLRELIDKLFLAPRSPHTYWVNPALFFKGDRVMFIKEYRRKTKTIHKIQNN